MSVTKQNADGSESIIREVDSFETARMGGYMTLTNTYIDKLTTSTTGLPTLSTSNTAAPNQGQAANFGGGILEFNCFGSGSVGSTNADNSHGLLYWNNVFPYDIIVTGFWFDVMTASSNGSSNVVSFGVTTNTSTGSAATGNLLTSHVTTNTGTFTTSAPIGQKVVSGIGNISGSVTNGTSGTLIARAIIEYVQSPAAGTK